MSKKVVTVRCPSCSAAILYDVKAKKWQCNYCMCEFDAKHMNNIIDSSIDTKGENCVIYKCNSCGSELVTDKDNIVTKCLYCDNESIIVGKLSGEFKPDFIIPFNTTIEDAKREFSLLSKRNPMMSLNFDDIKNINEIKPVYVPFVLYDMDVNGYMSFNYSDDTMYGSQVFEKIKYFEADFINFPFDSSTNFDNELMYLVHPYDFSKLELFNYSYLSGCLAEICNMTQSNMDNETKNCIIEAISDSVERKVGKRFNGNKDFNFNIKNRKHVLLPVWFINVKYNGKDYKLVMNGQTGAVSGLLPIGFSDYAAVYLLSLFVCLLINLIIYLISPFYGRGLVFFIIILLPFLVTYVFAYKHFKKGRRVDYKTYLSKKGMRMYDSKIDSVK